MDSQDKYPKLSQYFLCEQMIHKRLQLLNCDEYGYNSVLWSHRETSDVNDRSRKQPLKQLLVQAHNLKITQGPAFEQSH